MVELNPTLKRAAYLLIFYAAADLLVTLIVFAFPCVSCTPALILWRIGYVIGAVAFDILIGICAYAGMHRNLGAFIADLVILSIRLLAMVAIGSWFLIAFVGFFGYWAYVGVATCVSLRRAEQVLEAIKNLPPPEPDEPPPAPWIPPRQWTRPPQ